MTHDAVWRVISYSATVAAIAAFSESVAIGMRAARSHAATQLRRAARRARRRRAASSSPSPGPCSGSRRRRASATRSPGSSPMSLTRASATVKIAPMLARTALGPCGSAQPGPSATHDAPKASAERSTVPTLPGSPTPYRYTHSGRRARSSAARRRRSRACPSRARRRSRARSARPHGSRRCRARSRPAGSPRRAGARRARPLPAGPRPRPGTGRCGRGRAWCAGGARPSGGGCVGIGFGSCHKKSAVLFRSDAREAVCRLPVPRPSGVRQPTPRGRPRRNVGTCRRRARRCRRAPCGRARRRPASGRA